MLFVDGDLTVLLYAHGIHTRQDFDDQNFCGPVFDALYERYVDEMPYGTAKARTGDPMLWIAERVCREMGWE